MSTIPKATNESMFAELSLSTVAMIENRVFILVIRQTLLSYRLSCRSVSLNFQDLFKFSMAMHRACKKRCVDHINKDGDTNITHLPRRPRSSISAIEIANTSTTEGHWQTLSVSKGSWVLMQPDRRRKRRSGNNFLTSWKGRVLDLRTKDGKKMKMEILVQHVYMHRELVLLDEPDNFPHYRPNCK